MIDRMGCEFPDPVLSCAAQVMVMKDPFYIRIKIRLTLA